MYASWPRYLSHNLLWDGLLWDGLLRDSLLRDSLLEDPPPIKDLLGDAELLDGFPRDNFV